MKSREVDFSDSSTKKGMDRSETVETYYKYISLNKIAHHRIAKRALQLKSDAEIIVDIGTGPGFIAIELAKISGKKIKAVDLSPNMLIKASELAKKEKVDIEFIESSCFELPFKDKSVELVTASSLIHCLDDPNPFFVELKRIMKPGGRALVSGYKRNTFFLIKNVMNMTTTLFLREKALDGMKAVFDASFTRGEITDLLEKVGITNYKVYAGFIRLEAVIGF